MNLDLDGKVALITGAGSGMGRATARLFATEGARVMVADIDGANAEETVRRIAQASGAERAAAVVGDVSQRADAKRYVDETVERFGRLDVLVNCAGLEGFNTWLNTSDGDWERMFAVNARGPYLLVQAAVPRVAEAGGGAIVNIASAAALRGNVGLAAYSAAKAALISLTRNLAIEVAPLGIRVNAIAPGLIDTRMARVWIDRIGGMDAVMERIGHNMPIHRAGRPEEIASAVAFLASSASSYITGVVLPVDGGMNA